MRIAFNPSTVAALTAPPNNKDITFDLRGRNIFARGVKFLGTDTNTWRDIKVNNVSIGSHILDLRNGSNTTLTNTNGVVTINSTWRPVVDNLTSDSTTSSLSAKQGKVLKSLIDGKSNSGHTHDDRYLKLTGGTMTGTINRRSGGSTISGRDHAIIRLTYAPGGSSWNPIACVDTETGTWTLGHLSLGSSNTDFNFCFSTNTDYNAGNNAGNYVALRNKGGIIALTSEIPSSLKNPHALTISLNGTSQGPYDGSAAKNINITPSSIGAATSRHNHDDRYLKLTGGIMQLGEGLKFHADNNYFGTNTGARIISLLDNNGKICDGGLIIDERATLDGKEYVTELLRIRDFEFKWRGSNILHSGNSYINGSTIKINNNSITVYSSGTADGRYVKKSGDTMSGVLTIDTANFGALTIKRNDDVNGASIQFRGKSNVYGYIGLNSSAKDKLFLRWTSNGSVLYTILDTSSTYTSNGKGVINGTTITQVDNATNSDKVDGLHATSGNNKPWGTIPAITSNGYMDIGKHLKFHYDNTTGSDYSTALMCLGNYSNIVYLPSASGTLALTSQVLTWKSLIIDMRNYSESYWHPVTVKLPYTGYNKIKVSVLLNSGDKPSWAIHNSGITCNMEIWATASGWGATDSDTICLNYTYKFCSQNPCGWMQLDIPSLGVLFLRGGSRYRVYTDFDATFTPHDLKYTWTSGSYSLNTGGPYTSCPGLNFNKNKIYANLDGYASRLEGGSIPGWGTLTAANGFTNVSSYNYGSNGAYGLCGKNSALYMLLDGYFYQKEGKYRVLDTSDLSSVTNHIMVSLYTTEDANYPLVWSNQSNTNSAVGNQLYKSWADLYYNPKNRRLHTNRYVGSYANLTLTSMRHIDAALNSKNTDHNLYIGYGAQTYTVNTCIYASTGSGDTTSAQYLLALFNTSAGINLDSNINARPSIIFRNEASYKTTLSYSTAGNEALCFETKSAVTSIIFYNGATYAATSNHWYDIINGVLIKNNCLAVGAGWASGVNPDYKLKVGGDIYSSGHLIANNIASSWLDGQRYNNAGYNLKDVSDTLSYYPWMRLTNTGSAKWFSIGILNNSFYILGSKTSRTENLYDYAWRFDLSNGWAYGNFSNADTVDGVHLEWSGLLAYDLCTYLAGWTNDGKKIKAVSKNLFASSGHTHSNYVTALGTSGNYLTWVKNGSTNNITVPYATTSSYLTNGFSAPYVNKWDCNAPDRVVYSDYGSSGRSITNAPSGWNYGSLLELGHINCRGLNGALNILLMWDVAHGTTNPGTLWFRGKDNVKGWAKSWAKVITDLNISSILSNYYTKSESDGKYVTLATTLTIGGSKTFTTGIKFNVNNNGNANLGSGDGFKLFYNRTSGSNFPGNYYNVASFMTDYTGFLLACYGGANLYLKYRHREDNGTWHPWKTLAFTTDIPSSLKNPYVLTLKANGTTLAIYDGSSAKEANFTYANVGAASSSHTHTYIVAEDLRAKYPALILDPQRMKLSFLAALTLGIKNDGSYYDVITVRSYGDSSGGSDNALLFSKNTNSLYHTRFAFGSTSSWGSPLLIIDSGNIGSQSVAYASSAGSVAWSNVTGRPSSLKNPYSLNVFGVAYDGSAAKTVTTSTFVSLISEATSTITDGTMLITSYASNNGFADTNAVNVPYKRKAIHLWDYIKAKTDTLYSGKSHTHSYLPLAGGTMNANARISHGDGNLYIGRADNNGWIYTQDIASQSGTDKWTIKTSGAASFGSIHIASKSDGSFNSNVIECNSTINLNYYSSLNISLGNGGGCTIVGPYTTDNTGNNKLFVNGSEFINGASNVRLHVYADGFRHRSHNSNDSVLLAGGGYSQGVPVRYWAIYLIYIGGSSTDVTYFKHSGNHDFITSKAWELEGSVIFEIDFPSGYDSHNTLIFGNGDHRINSYWITPVYVAITTNVGSASRIRVMIANDASLDVGFASIYFMCMG